MAKIEELKNRLSTGEFDDKLRYLYSCNDNTKKFADRYISVLNGYESNFGSPEDVSLFSAPGRTEIGGNHTDHQHGCILAGSVNLDVIAAVKLNGTNQVRIKSQG